MKHISTVVVITALLCASTAYATVWYVHPDSAMNCVQDCLDSCSIGDTVLVGTGVYSENIVWPNTQGIDLVSECGVDMTYLDGDSTGSVIEIDVAIDTTTRISGFTIQNGYANAGGGIACRPGASPTITDNTISQNIAYGYALGGGGIATESASPVITNNIITDNSAPAGAGAGILCASNSNPTIANNTITNNICSTMGGGGGILVYVNCAPTITGNYVADNIACDGGGLCFQTTTSLVTNNIIIGNTAYERGGGIDFTHDDSSTFTGNTITNNTAMINGGGINCKDSSAPHIEYCTIANNNGDGVYCYENSSPVINYNNITDNDGYAILNVSSITIDAENNWWGDSTGPYHPTTNPGGLGNTVSDYVDYNPWLTSPGIEEYKTSAPLMLNLQVTPNPFHHITDIRCQITDDGTKNSEVDVGIRIYDASGRLVKNFRRSSIIGHPLSVSWDGTDRANRPLGSGVYFIKLTTGDYEETAKVLFVR